MSENSKKGKEQIDESKVKKGGNFPTYPDRPKPSSEVQKPEQPKKPSKPKS